MGFDTDGNGSIDVSELKAAFSAAGRELVNEEIEEILKSADTNGDGQIDFAEFKVLMAVQAPDLDTASKASKTSNTSSKASGISGGISAFKGLARGFMKSSKTTEEAGNPSPVSQKSSKSSVFSSLGRKRGGS